MAWSDTQPFKFLVGTATEHVRNDISIVEMRDQKLVTVATAEHRYRPSKMMFVAASEERIFATASDTVYLWDQTKRRSDPERGGRVVLQSPYDSAQCFADYAPAAEDTLEPLALPPQWSTAKYCAPIVGFDIVGSQLVAAHCEGHCMVWDLNTQQPAAGVRKPPPVLAHMVNFGAVSPAARSLTVVHRLP